MGVVDHAERVFDRHRLRPFGLQVDIGAAIARQYQRLLAVDQVAAVELGADVHRQLAIAQGFGGASAVRGCLDEIATQADENLGIALEHGVDCLDGVVAVMPRHLELEALFQGIEQGHRWPLVDAHGAVALHVAVAAHWAQTGPGPAQVAAQQHEVGDFLDGRHRMAMLGDAHGPAHDHILRRTIHMRGLFHIGQVQPGLLNDVCPRRGIDDGQVFLHGGGMFIDEGMVEHGRRVIGLGFALPLQQELGHAAHQCHVAAQGRAQVGGIGRAVAVGEHFQRVLRMLEAFQATLLERVDTDHLGTALDRLAQGLKHARVVGARVLAPDENRIGVLEVIEGDGAFADPDALRQRDTTGLVAHVRAVREIVGAIGAHEQLVQIRRFIAGTARGIELGLIGAFQVQQVLGDQVKGALPADGLVAITGGVIDHRVGQATLVFKPIIALLKQCADTVARKEGRVDPALGRFPVDRLGAVLAELDHTAFRRVAPGAARAVEATVLVGLEQGTDILQSIVAAKPGLGHAAQGAPAAGGTVVGLVARCRGLIGSMMHAHAELSIAGL
ncbi:hypothetical protein D9M71_288350 [compost metagenome]